MQNYKKAISRTSILQLKVVCELNVNTGGPLDMRILGLVKIRISGKSHSENQKVIIPYVHDFSLICGENKHEMNFIPNKHEL